MKKSLLFLVSCCLISFSSWAKMEPEDLRLQIETRFLEEWADRLQISNHRDIQLSKKQILLDLRAHASTQVNEVDVKEYLVQSGIRYLESGDPGQKSFEILGLEEGPWLNRIAWDLLMENRTALFLRPALIKESNYGVYRSEKQRIELVLPPWRGGSTEFLSHETYHALIMKAVKEGAPHLLSGYIQAPEGLKVTYPHMDLSELGAYVETLNSIAEMWDLGYAPADVAKLLRSYHSTLSKMSGVVVRRFDEILAGPLDRMSVVRLDHKKGVEFYARNPEGEYLVLHNFGFELARGPSTEWNVGKTPEFQEGAMDRLQFQRDLFRRFQNRVEDLGLALKLEQYGLFQVRVRQLREFLVDLNREWLLHLQITRGTHPYLIDSITANLIRSQRDCQSVLVRR